MSYYLIFITGLTSGGLTCLALQGGLLSSLVLENEKQSNGKSRLRTTIVFLLAKFFAYLIVGLLLGLIGEILAPTVRMTGYINILLSLYMLGLALEILNVHPIFKYLVIQPPKFIRRKIRSISKNGGDFSAILLGIVTVLIPCATTQAMMSLAISSGNALKGLLIMGTFILGTVPLFMALGYFLTTFSQAYQKVFMNLIALFLIVLSIYNFTNSLRIIGVNTKIVRINKQEKSEKIIKAEDTGTIQKITIKLNDKYGYSPDKIEIKAGIPVQLTLVNDNAHGCVKIFTIPDYNLSKMIPATGSTTLDFTPKETGKLSFTCPMGMYYGEFIIK